MAITSSNRGGGRGVRPVKNRPGPTGYQGMNSHGPAYDKTPGQVIAPGDGNPPASGGISRPGFQGVNSHGPAVKPGVDPGFGVHAPSWGGGRPAHTGPAGGGGGGSHGAYRPGDQMPGGFINAGWIKDPNRPGLFVPLVKRPNGGSAIHPAYQNGRHPSGGGGGGHLGRPQNAGAHAGVGNSNPNQGALADALNPKPKPEPFSAPWLQGFTGGGGWLPLAGGGWFNPNTWQSWKPGDPIPGQPGGGGYGSTGTAGGGAGTFEQQVYQQLLKAFGGI